MVSRNPPANQPEDTPTPRTHRVPLGAAAVVLPRPSDAELSLVTTPAADRGTNGRAAVERGPRHTLIIVFDDGDTICPELIAERIPAALDRNANVIVVCAGQPANLPGLQRTFRHAQLMLAPAGTTAEELRVLALAQTSGDIVTLVSGATTHIPALADREQAGG